MIASVLYIQMKERENVRSLSFLSQIAENELRPSLDPSRALFINSQPVPESVL